MVGVGALLCSGAVFAVAAARPGPAVWMPAPGPPPSSPAPSSSPVASSSPAASPSPVTSPSPAASSNSSDPPVTVARYGFDGAGPDVWADISGQGHPLSPVAGNGAAVVRRQHGAGKAVRFPRPCGGESCPRLALRAPSTAALNPGSRPLRYAATVRLATEETSSGQNILQKGYSAEGSQYKLQIDGRAGRPSCALVGDSDRIIHLAVAGRTVADGSWHTVECRRSGTRLSVLVDGAEQGRTEVPADLSISNDEPLSLGAKSAYGDNDQFHGLLDDVWIAIG